MFFLHAHKETFIVYSFNKRDAQDRGTKQDFQRFEQCIIFIEMNVQPALQALFATKYFDEETQHAAKELTMEVVRDIIAEVKVMKKIEDEDYRKKLVRHLNNIKLSVMFPDDALNQTIVDEMYEELEVNLNYQSYIELHIALKKHNDKIINAEKTTWIRRTDKLIPSFASINYFWDENVLSEKTFLLDFTTVEQSFMHRRSRYVHFVSLFPCKPFKVLQHGDTLCDDS